MTSALLAESSCAHDDDRRGPLPYDGKPPRGDEWECLDCGMWHVAERRAGFDVADWPDISVEVQLRAGEFLKSLVDLNQKIARVPSAAAISYDPNDAPFTFDASSASEILRSIGATYRVDGAGSLVISLDVTGDDASRMRERVSDGLAVKRAMPAAELRVSAKISTYDYLEEYHDLDRIVARAGVDRWTTVEVSRETWRKLHVAFGGRLLSTPPTPSTLTTFMGRPIAVSRDVADDHLVFVVGS